MALARMMTAASIACMALGGCGARPAEEYVSRPYATRTPAVVAPPTAAAFPRRGDRPLWPSSETAPEAPEAPVAIAPEAPVVIAPESGQSQPSRFGQDAGPWQQGRVNRDQARAALDRYQRERLAYPDVPPAPFRGAGPGLPVTPFIGARPLPGDLPAP